MGNPTMRRIVVTAILWAGITLAFCAAVIEAARAESCMPVDPAAMVWTGHGFSIAMGDGHLWINRHDVIYAEVAQPHVCMPRKGMMQLWLPHAWPSYAQTGIILAHQKLVQNSWIDSSSNKKGERCCDAGKDCHSIAPERVRPTEGGVTVQLDTEQVFIPGEQIMPSEDGKYWLCYWGGQVKCFFAPYSGS